MTLQEFALSEPMHYWAMPANLTKEKRQQMLKDMVDSGDYYWSIKTDGNWSRAIIDKNG